MVYYLYSAELVGFPIEYCAAYAGMVELADAQDLGAVTAEKGFLLHHSPQTFLW